MFADCLGITCEVVDAKELGALGACMAAGIQVGIYKDYEDASNRMVKIKRIFEPKYQNTEVYEKKYQKYIELAEAIGKVGI